MKQYYVYGLFIKGRDQPFYVGKTYAGSRRLYNHWLSSRKSATSLLYRYLAGFSSLDEIEEKILFKSYDEGVVFLKERELILHYGRLDQGKGILLNSTNGGQGSSSTVYSRKSKRVYLYTLEGKYIGEYPSLVCASKSLKLNRSHASAVATGSRPYLYSSLGYIRVTYRKTKLKPIELNKVIKRSIVAIDQEGYSFNFKSITFASRKLGIDTKCIRRVLSGESKYAGDKTKKRWTFKYDSTYVH